MKHKVHGDLFVISREELTDGYDDHVVVTRSVGDLEYEGEIYRGGVMHGQLEYKGRKRTKTFRGETAHSDLDRWIRDMITPLIHAGKGI